MSGFNHERPCLSAARAFLAGAAILAGAATTMFSSVRAQDAPEDIAFAAPRLVLPGGGSGLPRPLEAADARRVREAFAHPLLPLEGMDAWLPDPVLGPILGHVLADRFAAAPSRVTPEELRAWLSRFAQLPDAPAVHAMLVARLPRGTVVPPLPVLPGFAAAPFGDDVEAGLPGTARSPGLERGVRDAARAGEFDRALRLITRSRGMSAAYGAVLRSEVAQAMFSQGQDRLALTTAAAAHTQSRGTLAAAAWLAGVSAWRLDEPRLALGWFDSAYRASVAAPGQRAKAAFWAARASLVTGGTVSGSTAGEYGSWLQRAAANPRTFYGLLARHKLGQRIPTPDAPLEVMGEADVDVVSGAVRGRRALALLQVGQPARAAAELRLLWSETRDSPGVGRSVLLVARAAGLADLAGQLAGLMDPASVRLPSTRLQPAGGFQLDPALVYALTRLESNFDADAVSPAGARGLMQLMPSTAGFVLAGNGPLARTPALYNPATNLDLGQRYLLQLTQRDSIGSDLIRMLTAYNAGPGTFGKWMDVMAPEDDPLLFIESIPGAEARAYVPRALAYSWLYAAQLRLPAPSLDELAVGLWPRVQARKSAVPSLPKRLH